MEEQAPPDRGSVGSLGNLLCGPRVSFEITVWTGRLASPARDITSRQVIVPGVQVELGGRASRRRVAGPSLPLNRVRV